MAWEVYMSSEEIALALSVSRRTAQRKIEAGLFSGVINLGTADKPVLRVPRSSFEAFCASVAWSPAEVVRTAPALFSEGIKARTPGELRRKEAAA